MRRRSSFLHLRISSPPLPPQIGSLRQRDVADLDVLIAPLVEQLDAANLVGDLLGKNLVARGLNLDFDFGVRHVGDDLTCGVVVGDVNRGSRESKYSLGQEVLKIDVGG